MASASLRRSLKRLHSDRAARRSRARLRGLTDLAKACNHLLYTFSGGALNSSLEIAHTILRATVIERVDLRACRLRPPSSSSEDAPSDASLPYEYSVKSERLERPSEVLEEASEASQFSSEMSTRAYG